jgi:hypothetical protein
MKINFNNMKTINKTKTTTLMIITAALIGSIGINSHSAYADIIDFETGFNDLDPVSAVITSNNVVTFAVGPDDQNLSDAFIALDDAVSGDTSAYQPDDEVPSLAPGGDYFLTDETEGPDLALDYFISFEYLVSSLSLDLYDYRADGGPSPDDTATLTVFDVGGSPIGADTFTIPNPDNTDNPNFVELSVNPNGLIKSAQLSFDKPDVGTGIDNIEFESALVKTSNCTDTDPENDDTPLEVLIKKHDFKVECEFTIEFTGEGDDLSIHDTVPAEWEVITVNGAPADDEEALALEGCEVMSKNGKAATHIWCDGDSAPITVETETRPSPGKGHDKKGETVFKPTFCGIISLNDGATLLDEEENVLAVSNSLHMLVSEEGIPENDCDGDGLSDALEYEIGTDPASDPKILETTIDPSPGSAELLRGHISTQNAWSGSGTVVVHESGAVVLTVSGLLNPNNQVQNMHNYGHAALTCFDGDTEKVTPNGTPLGNAAAVEGDATIDDTFGPLPSCGDPIVLWISDGNNKWLARSSP